MTLNTRRNTRAGAAPKKKSRAQPTDRLSPLHLDLAERLSQEIVNGELGAGDHLTEVSLGARFEVSRTPVRGALKLLAQHKMIENRPNAGYFVSDGMLGKKLPDFSGTGMTGTELYRTLIDHRARKLLPDALTDKELLSRYPVSRSLMNKTLVKLSTDGLIEKRKGQGWRFLPSLETPEALADSYRFRILIECSGLLEPTFQFDPIQLQRCRQGHERLLQLPETELSPNEFYSLNAAFHEMLARFSGNRFILQAMQQQNQLRRLEEHDAFYRVARLQESCHEHLQILQAIENNDREWAAALMRRHLAGAMSMIQKENGQDQG
ncbi:MAG: GntR family transcriptional regulator [Proteobacteria bacterium]|nr:GntR family transcriptional regulator [Pseudomonadota bacterium]